ncbi:hypothetical protein Athai_39530 [Actinocatenispora thailandica]|uniref:Proline dehydrogenase n=1 Tax=Actinocatenispora thailandica TaxID=227318 RepID=A0A7R7DRA2_9ACTN|nr:(2Fe-2S)-binding protein [Actinocatenispora thailandica]BCJ36450.1 hypothetical protein Athai_39530 [Actinocatenispora thailandica]
MSSRAIRPDADVLGRADRPVTILVDGTPVTGIAGQSIAGVLLAAGRTAWRYGPTGGARGVFCGIGVCFDCLLTVNGIPDVRACRRRARDGDVIATQSRAAAPSTVDDNEAGGEPEPPAPATTPSSVDGAR